MVEAPRSPVIVRNKNIPCVTDALRCPRPRTDTPLDSATSTNTTDHSPCHCLLPCRQRHFASHSRPSDKRFPQYQPRLKRKSSPDTIPNPQQERKSYSTVHHANFNSVNPFPRVNTTARHTPPTTKRSFYHPSLPFITSFPFRESFLIDQHAPHPLDIARTAHNNLVTDGAILLVKWGDRGL
jgi:hypothetical protein